MTKKTQAAQFAALHEVGALAYAAGEHTDAANKERGNALNLALVALTQPGILNHTFAFDVRDKSGNIIESARRSLRDRANGEGFRNSDGTDYRAAQSAFRTVVLAEAFGVQDDKGPGANAVWALVAGKAVPAAMAAYDEGMTAVIAPDGKIKLEGGKGERADALRAAADKSASALVKAAKGEAGTNQTRDAERAATPSEILKAALDIVRKAAKGEEALSGPALSFAREIAHVIEGNADAFAE